VVKGGYDFCNRVNPGSPILSSQYYYGAAVVRWISCLRWLILIVALTSLWVSYRIYHDHAMIHCFVLTLRYTTAYFACLTRQVKICFSVMQYTFSTTYRSLFFSIPGAGSARCFISPAVTFRLPSCYWICFVSIGFCTSILSSECRVFTMCSSDFSPSWLIHCMVRCWKRANLTHTLPSS
jgi:hypothetical protein